MTIDCKTRDRHNLGTAALNRNAFAKCGITAVSIFGGPGCGKTSLLQATLQRLGDHLRIGAIVGNDCAQEDSDRLRNLSPHVTVIETTDLNASLIHDALEHTDLSDLDLMLIERTGAPANMSGGYVDLGQTANVGIFSVSGGSDKVARYPHRVENSDLLLLTKADLLSHMYFDQPTFQTAIRLLNASVPLIEVSVMTSQGLDHWFHWLTNLAAPQGHANDADGNAAAPEYFVG